MMHLRNMNTYVASALGDWTKSHHLQPRVPLQAAPHPSAVPELKAAGAHPSITICVLLWDNTLSELLCHQHAQTCRLC